MAVPIYANVRDFGATGNGSTDDTQAFQDALDAAPDNKARLFVPRGFYLITSALVIPRISGQTDRIKAIIFMGEGGQPQGGTPSGFAGGASVLLGDVGSNEAVIDAKAANQGADNDQRPLWSGGLENITIGNAGSSGMGVLAGSIIDSHWIGAYINGFSTNLKVTGSFYYTSWDRCLFRGGLVDFNADPDRPGQGVEANGALFFRCRFNCPARFGLNRWPGVQLQFVGCYFEDTGTDPQLVIHRASSVYFNHCYYEDKDDKQTWLEFQSLSNTNAQAILKIENMRARIPADNGCLVDVRAGSSSAELTVVLDSVQISAEGSGVVAIRKNASSFPNPIHISSRDNTSQGGDSCPLFSGTGSDVATWNLQNCPFAAAWAPAGARNSVKPAF